MYRNFRTAAFDELERGRGGIVAGLRFLTGRSKEEGETVAANMETGAVKTAGVETGAPSGTFGHHTVPAFSGKREDVEKGMSALFQERKEFVGDLEPGKRGTIFGYFNHWVPPSQRGETYGSDLRMRDMGVA